ncbi:MAG: hypothetical protein AAF597_02350, partial [Bacteroidota bacterium]
RNIGVVPYQRVLEETSQSAFAIYPSLQESLGLGLVESASLDCKVLAADLPYTYEAIEPSATFNPFKVEEIYKAVYSAIQGTPLPPTRRVMKNCLPELIAHLCR